MAGVAGSYRAELAAGLAGAVVLALAFRPGPAPVWRYAPTVDGECSNGLPPPSDLSDAALLNSPDVRDPRGGAAAGGQQRQL